MIRVLIAALTASALISCGGAPVSTGYVPINAPKSSAQPPSGNAFGNPGFETGKFPPWFKCFRGEAKISTYDPYRGKYSGFVGSSNDKEGEKGNGGAICQEIVVPNNPYFTAHLRPVSDDHTKGYGQEIDVYNATNGKFIDFLWVDNKNSKTWIYLHKSVKPELESYAGDKVIVAFEAVSPGNKNKHIGLWFDNADMYGK